MLKWTHLTDLHLGSYKGKLEAGGVNSRFLDFVKTYDEAIDFTINKNCDFCLITGDIFRYKDPQPIELEAFTSGIKKLTDNNIIVVIILGNHDLFLSAKLKNSISALKVLNLKNVIISENPEVLQIESRGQKINIQTMPYQMRNLLLMDDYNLVSEYMEKKINEDYETIDLRYPTIFGGHFSIKDAVSGSEQKTINKFKEPIISKEIFVGKKYIYVGMGHLHTYQKVLDNPLCIYGGSINRVDFNEWKEDKGFVYLEYENEKINYNFIKVDAKRFVLLQYDLQDEELPEEYIIKDLINSKSKFDNSIVKMSITLSDKNKNNYNGGMINKLLNEYNCDIFEPIIPHILRSDNAEHVSYEKFSNPSDALNTYCYAQKNITNKEKFLKIGEEIIKKSNLQKQ